MLNEKNKVVYEKTSYSYDTVKKIQDVLKIWNIIYLNIKHDTNRMNMINDPICFIG